MASFVERKKLSLKLASIKRNKDSLCTKNILLPSIRSKRTSNKKLGVGKIIKTLEQQNESQARAVSLDYGLRITPDRWSKSGW